MKRTKKIPLSQIKDKEARAKEHAHRQACNTLIPGKNLRTKYPSLDDYDGSPDSDMSDVEGE